MATIEKNAQFGSASMPEKRPSASSEQKIDGLIGLAREKVKDAVEFLTRELHIRNGNVMPFSVDVDYNTKRKCIVNMNPAAFYRPAERGIYFSVKYLAQVDEKQKKGESDDMDQISTHETLHHLRHILHLDKKDKGIGYFKANEAFATFGEALLYSNTFDFKREGWYSQQPSLFKVSYSVGVEAARNLMATAPEKKLAFLEEMINNPDDKGLYNRLLELSKLKDGLWKRLSFARASLSARFSYYLH